MRSILLILALSVFMSNGRNFTVTAQPVSLPWLQTSIASMEKELLQKYGESQKEQIARGLRQTAQFWRTEDGDATAFEQFVRLHFAGNKKTRDTMFERFEVMFEALDGHMTEISRIFRTQSDLDRGVIYPFDEIFAGYSPSAHLNDDFFQNKLAFTVLLNFPLTTLDQRTTEGKNWTRRQWAETRLADRFSKRIPANVLLEYSKTSSEVDQYISEYNIWMHHIIDKDGKRLFPAKMRLLSHWNLRDQIKADYAGGKEGFARQKSMLQVMDGIIAQSIPASVVNNPHLDWNPFTNEVKKTTAIDFEGTIPSDLIAADAPEPDTRYAMLLKSFQASTLIDPFSPAAPTLIARRFNEDRELSEPRVDAMFRSVLSSPLVPKIAALIEKRLGRPLEPFDIWYNGFKPKSAYTEAQLDEIVSKKYPDGAAFEKDIPNLLLKLGFSKERADFLAGKIAVDPARGSGHAMGAAMRSEKARLRTRVDKSGMNFKGFNIAIHEMGHNVEQVFSLNMIDHTSLQGVPNTAFTEAMAFVFQARDMELLGLSSPSASDEAVKTINDFWMTYEIAGVALVDMAVWRWMYDHPKATPAELKTAVISIAKDIWNQYYAPVFKKKDIALLAIYSHMIDSFLYLPDYPIGHLIAFQIEEQMKKGSSLGAEVERMTTMGRIAPDVWMMNATGKPVGADALLEAAGRAIKNVK